MRLSILLLLVACSRTEAVLDSDYTTDSVSMFVTIEDAKASLPEDADISALTRAGRVWLVPTGTACEIIETQGRYVKVRTRDRIGWVYAYAVRR